MINIESTVYLKVISPIHVGGAQEKNLVEGLDFLTIDGREYRIRESELYNLSNGIDPDKLSNILLTGDKVALQKHIKEADPTKSKIVYPLTGKKGSTGDIKAFIRSGLNGKSYIPGSSLKGAMRSAVAHYLCNGSSGSNPDKEFIKDFDSSLFRFIKVSDTHPFGVRLFRSKIASLGDAKKIKWKEKRNLNTEHFSADGFDTSFESPELNTLCDFQVKIGQPFMMTFKNQLTEMHPDSRNFLLEDGIINRFLFAINAASSDFLIREVDWHKKYKGSQSDRIIKELEGLQKFTKIKGYCLLHLGAGSGFHAMTGDWQYESHHNLGKYTENDARKYGLTLRQRNDYIGKKEKFKSRRIAFDQWPNPTYFGPMGFVLLSLTPFSPEQTGIEASGIKEEAQIQEVREIKPVHRKVTVKPGTILDGVVKEEKMVDVYMPDSTIKTVKLVSGSADPGKIIEVSINPDGKGNFHHASFKGYKK